MNWWRDREIRNGGILIITLVFVVMFVVIFVSLAGYASRQFKQGAIESRDELAFQVAEAGLNYGRWRLAHDGEDTSSETRSVEDQFAGVIGSFDISFGAPLPGSSVTLITARGRTQALPAREVMLEARYGIPSLAKYASITNSDVWYGGEIQGAVHANGGIRMDGQSDSIMTSAKETYICLPIHGCSNEEKPGIWGVGERQELWEFPVTPVDYNSLTLDLLNIKDQAVSDGTYWGPGAGSHGYHLVFQADNTYALYRVTKKTSKLWSYATDTGWQNTSHDISEETLLETNAVPSGGVMYIEDTLWVNGDIRDRVTVAAGKFPDQPSTNVDIIINGNIDYGGVTDGTRVFAAIAQKNVLIPYSAAPDNLRMDGAYIAQKGNFGRRYYSSGPHRLKSSLIRFGMIASNLVPVTAWVNGSGTVISGYQSGQATYDFNLLYGPPPYFPSSGQYQFLSWEQIE